MYIKALIYGTPGAGKTRFAADAPKPQWFDFENSTQTLRHIPEYKHLADKAVMYPDPKDLFNKIRTCVRDPEIETIVIDTMSSGVDTYMIDFMEKAAEASKGKRDEFKRYDSDYSEATNVWNKIFTRLSTAKINVVVIGHRREDKENTRDGEVTAIYPNVTPALRRSITQLVDFVGYMEIAKPGSTSRPAERRMYVNPTHLITAKNRFNIQQLYFDNPTWKEVFGNGTFES